MTSPRRMLVVVLLLAASVSACTSTTPSADPSATTPAAATGQATGVITGDDLRAQQINDIVSTALPELKLATVVFGVWQGDVEIVRGAIDAPSVQPATAVDARVRVGQPMEAMLGTVLLQLGAEGKVDLDAPVAPYLPTLVNADVITPRMLANSTGGTPDYVYDEDFEARVAANPFAGYTFDELLGYAQQKPPWFTPGTKFKYSHTEMAALVEVLEKASGQSLEQLMAERVFEPLGMTTSSAHQNNAIEAPMMHAFTGQRGVYEDSTFWDPTWGFNGGMNASVADLGRWLRALNTGELLSPAEATESLSPTATGTAPAPGKPYFAYGSVVAGGWILGNPSLNGYQGFTAQHRDPSLTIVVWSTAAKGNPETSNASQTISKRIAAALSDDPITL